MMIKLLAIAISLAIFIIVIELIRREKLTFRYACLWFAVSFLGVMFALFENILFRMARAIGFLLPSNFIFFLISLLFIISSLILTVYICQQNSHLEKITQKLGIMELELAQLKESLKIKPQS